MAPDGPLTERLGVRLRSSQTALLGFDFPIGVPRRYAELAGIEQFTSMTALGRTPAARTRSMQRSVCAQ